jgi:hypothetical protein
MRYQWNTGRGYAEDGQRMVAEVVGNELRFADLSRHIQGTIPLGAFHRLDRESIGFFQEFVMFNYDYGNYSGDSNNLTWEETK